jgi:hypothetical protein
LLFSREVVTAARRQSLIAAVLLGGKRAGVITKPSWDRVQPGIRYVPCQAIPGSGRLAAKPYFICQHPEPGTAAPMELAAYERTTGLFAENVRLAQWLADEVGIPCEEIQVIPPALSTRNGSLLIQRPYVREAPRRKLLLCVSDCDVQPAAAESVRLVLDVLDILRREHDSRIRLTVSSLETRPAGTIPPRGVTFRGVPMVSESIALFDSHDLLVVPGPGTNGLPEALSRGVPSVVVRASEMSEAITPGVTGAVVEDGRAPVLAAAIASVLANDYIYRSCFERAPAMTAYFSWERAGRKVTPVVPPRGLWS